MMSEWSHVVHGYSWPFWYASVEVKDVDDLYIVWKQCLSHSAELRRIFLEKFENFRIFHVLIEALLKELFIIFFVVFEDQIF